MTEHCSWAGLQPAEPRRSGLGAMDGFKQTLTDAQEQLASIDADLRGRLHKEFLQQVTQVEPLLREQGKRCFHFQPRRFLGQRQQ
jgi:hypothetical protein